MARTPAMRPCPDCRAPNPERLERCYACGQSLTKRRDGEPLPGERTYPCLNCGTEMAYRSQNCPNCGRAATPPSSVLTNGGSSADPSALILLPSGWDTEPLPDGTTRLARSGWRWVGDTNWTAYAFAPGLALLTFMMLRSSMVPRSERVGLFPTWIPFLMLGLFVAGGLFLLVAAIFGREELRVGPGFLEWRRYLFGFQSVRRFTDIGVFSAASRTYHTKYGTRTFRRLEVQNLGKRIQLDSREVSETWSALASMMADMAGAKDEIATLGRYLAAKTGWRFTDFDFPERGKGFIGSWEQ